MRSPLAAHLAVMLAAFAEVAPTDSEREFLLSRGWVPLGACAFTGVEDWHCIVRQRLGFHPVPKADALEIERERLLGGAYTR
jgi:hypothetical protein